MLFWIAATYLAIGAALVAMALPGVARAARDHHGIVQWPVLVFAAVFVAILWPWAVFRRVLKR